MLYIFILYFYHTYLYIYIYIFFFLWGFSGCTVVKNLSANAGEARGVSLIPGSGRSPGGGNGENSMDKGA